MIAWFKKIYRKLRSPEFPPVTVIHCRHSFEILAVKALVADVEMQHRHAKADIDRALRRELCYQLAQALYDRAVITVYPTSEEDPLSHTYVASVRVLRDGAAKETK